MGMARGDLNFGIFPGSALGDTELSGPLDLPGQINQALDTLQGTPERPFIVRAYDIYIDPGDTVQTTPLVNPVGYDRYLGRGRTLDLVISYHSRRGDVDGYCAFIERLIDCHGAYLATVQIAEEPNITDNASLDGAYPRVAEAVIEGVRTGKARVRRNGLRHVKIGINTSPLFGPSANFLAGLTQRGGEQFIADLDYIGLDFFPDVFRPLSSPDKLKPATQGLLEAHRQQNLVTAGLGHLPLVITEHGWPTGPDRPSERQSIVVRTVIEVLVRNAEALNIIGYTHHALRDARTDGSGILCQFGLMTDDYTPKPAFFVYCDLINQYSGDHHPAT